MRLTFGIFLRRLSLIVYIFWSASCSGPRNISGSAGQESDIVNQNQIVFLNYAFWKDQDSFSHITLINKTVTDGKMKGSSSNHLPAREGDLKCMTLDGEMRPVSTVIIPDPLIKRVEYQQENGALASKEVELDSTVFSVRMQLEAGSRYIAISRINPSDSSFLYVTEIK